MSTLIALRPSGTSVKSGIVTSLAAFRPGWRSRAYTRFTDVPSRGIATRSVWFSGWTIALNEGRADGKSTRLASPTWSDGNPGGPGGGGAPGVGTGLGDPFARVAIAASSGPCQTEKCVTANRQNVAPGAWSVARRARST